MLSSFLLVPVVVITAEQRCLAVKALTDNMGVILRGRHTWRPVEQLVCKQLRYLEEKNASETM